MKRDQMPQLAISILVILLFAYAYIRNPSDDLLVGALISMAATAVNWWLGSSKGSADKSDTLEQRNQGTQRVQIDQPADEPVPVEEAR